MSRLGIVFTMITGEIYQIIDIIILTKLWAYNHMKLFDA